MNPSPGCWRLLIPFASVVVIRGNIHSLQARLYNCYTWEPLEYILASVACKPYTRVVR
jgi:hypothetical protein